MKGSLEKKNIYIYDKRVKVSAGDRTSPHRESVHPVNDGSSYNNVNSAHNSNGDQHTMITNLKCIYTNINGMCNVTKHDTLALILERESLHLVFLVER